MTRLSLETPEEVRRKLADRARALRLDRGFKQSTLAARSGVSLGSLRRFEDTGRISLDHLLALAFALNRLDDFNHLLEPPPARTMAELKALDERPKKRQRGRR